MTAYGNLNKAITGQVDVIYRNTISSYNAVTAIPLGLGLFRKLPLGTATNGRVGVYPLNETNATLSGFIGVSVIDRTIVANVPEDNIYKTTDTIPVLQKGVCWIEPEDVNLVINTYDFAYLLNTGRFTNVPVNGSILIGRFLSNYDSSAGDKVVKIQIGKVI